MAKPCRSRSACAAATRWPAGTSRLGWPRNSDPWALKSFSRSWTMICNGLFIVEARLGPISNLFALHLFMQGHNAVDQRLGARRAAGHIDIHRHDLVPAPHDGVAVVHAAAGGAIS